LIAGFPTSLLSLQLRIDLHGRPTESPLCDDYGRNEAYEGQDEEPPEVSNDLQIGGQFIERRPLLTDSSVHDPPDGNSPHVDFGAGWGQAGVAPHPCVSLGTSKGR